MTWSRLDEVRVQLFSQNEKWLRIITEIIDIKNRLRVRQIVLFQIVVES